jgi:hypothetical protein
MKINNFLINLHDHSEKIPGVSFLSGLSTLFQKNVSIPMARFFGPTRYSMSQYALHMSSKSNMKALLIMIPLVNVIFFVINHIRWSKQETVRSQVLKNPQSFVRAHDDLKNDESFIISVFQDLKQKSMENRTNLRDYFSDLRSIYDNISSKLRSDDAFHRRLITLSLQQEKGIDFDPTWIGREIELFEV